MCIRDSDYIDAAMNESDIRFLFKSKNKQLTLLEDNKISNTLALDEVKGYISVSYTHLDVYKRQP